jgi:hypothetical protein
VETAQPRWGRLLGLAERLVKPPDDADLGIAFAWSAKYAVRLLPLFRFLDETVSTRRPTGFTRIDAWDFSASTT